MKNRINSGDCAVVWILFHVGFEPSLFCGKNSDIFLAFSRILYVCMCESTKINRLFYRTVFLPFVLQFSAHFRVISHFFWARNSMIGHCTIPLVCISLAFFLCSWCPFIALSLCSMLMAIYNNDVFIVCLHLVRKSVPISHFVFPHISISGEIAAITCK